MNLPYLPRFLRCLVERKRKVPPTCVIDMPLLSTPISFLFLHRYPSFFSPFPFFTPEAYSHRIITAVLVLLSLFCPYSCHCTGGGGKVAAGGGPGGGGSVGSLSVSEHF